MIGFLDGKLIFITPLTVLINVNGLGYEVNYRNELSNSDLGNRIELFVSHKFSEFGQVLYGFKSIEEKLIFENLASIKGIGPKTVFSIVSELKIYNYNDLREIKLDALTKVSGVGKTTAQKFLLGLSGKLKSEFIIDEVQDIDKLKEEFSEEIEVLVGWGIKKNDLLIFLSKHYDEISGKGKEKVIQFVLKFMK